MGRTKKGLKIDGWINLDKPAGLTSTQALGKVRRILNAQKAGHGGTLDPLATGILPIALGEATKTIPFCQDHLKAYSFAIKWGEERATDDAEGDVVATSPTRPVADAIRAILPRFTGDIMQTPPRYSAIKIDGERAYDLAREGVEVEMQPRAAYIEHLELIDNNDEQASFTCVCGKGTYMRSLARDIARELGSAGHIVNLRREAVGPFDLNNAVTLEQLEQRVAGALLPVEIVLDIPTLALQEAEAMRLRNGQVLSFISRPDMDRLDRAGLLPDNDNGALPALAVCNGRPVAIVEVEGVEIRTVRIIHLQN